MIYVFKTNVKTKKSINFLKPKLDVMIPNSKWNFDLEDCDKILRIGSDEDIVLKVTELLEINNYFCEELQ